MHRTARQLCIAGLSALLVAGSLAAQPGTSRVVSGQSRPTNHPQVRGMLGVSMENATLNPTPGSGRANTSDAMGVRLVRVYPGFPADRAGLESGDILVAMNGEPLSDARALQDRVAARDPGDLVTFTVYRRTGSREVRVRLGAWSEFLAPHPEFGPLVREVSLEPLNEKTRRRFAIPSEVEGLVVTAVAENSLYALLLTPGMVIESANGQPVREKIELVSGLAPGTNRLAVWQDGRRGKVAIRGF
ncbi:MAG: PDZ domain-containing protein [Opitutales bacterium]